MTGHALGVKKAESMTSSLKIKNAVEIIKCALLLISIAAYLTSLYSCTFHEYANELSVKGCVVAQEKVIYLVTPYSGSVPERIYLGDFDSLDQNNCFKSTIMWKSGGRTTLLGIPVFQGTVTPPDNFGLILHGASGETKGFTFGVSDKCIKKSCNIGTIKY